MRRLLLSLTALTVSLNTTPAQPPPELPGAKILIAFSSVRERRAPPYPRVFFYEHDGVANGKLVGFVETLTKGDQKTRSDMHPSLSRDGRFCAFSAQMGPTNGARIEVWDRQDKKLLLLPSIHESPKVHFMTPSVGADGKLVAFSVWARPGSTSRWGIFLYDTAEKKLIDLPKLNQETSDQRMPAISEDGRTLAYVSNSKESVGLTDIHLYDIDKKEVLTLPEVNSKLADVQPTLSGDGRLLAFASDRPGGVGLRDIYLYDRTAKQFLPLPGLNSAAHDQSPSLSADGRYLAFVSERLGGAGERDLYLYDRQTQKVLPTPGLNSKDDDYDPCVIVLGQSKK
jgi:dipeptidyl aminopeptidase/acylaminoacyl peptidase